MIENAGGDVEKAAEAERRIIEELRQMGNEVLHGWARRQQQKKEAAYNTQSGVNRKEKKSSTWYTRLGTIEIEEQIFTQGRQVGAVLCLSVVGARTSTLGAMCVGTA